MAFRAVIVADTDKIYQEDFPKVVVLKCSMKEALVECPVLTFHQQKSGGNPMSK